MNKKIDKKQILLILLSIYELIRALIIVQIPSGSENAIITQSAALIYSIPLLILPFIIVVGMIAGNEKLEKCGILLPLIKLLSCVSYIGYFCLNYKNAIRQLKFYNPAPFRSLIFMLIFFILDVIIGIILFTSGKSDKKEEETLCK